MRSRFLGTDYFFSRSPFEALGDLRLVSLPIPPLPVPDPPGQPINQCFDCDLGVVVNLEIDRFPIEGALSKFFADVVPRFLGDGERSSVDVGYGDQSGMEEARSEASGIGIYESLAGSIYEEKEEHEHPGCRSVASRTEILKGIEALNKFQFEIEELDFLQGKCEDAHEVDEAGLHFQVPNVKIPMGIIDVEFGLTITYPSGVAKSIFLVEDVPNKLPLDRDNLAVKVDSSTSNDPSNFIKFPCFEVSEARFELDYSSQMEEAYSSLLPIFEQRHSDELAVNAEELLGSIRIDSLEHFTDYCPSEHSIEQKPLLLNSILDMDIININDKNLLEENLVIYPIKSDGACSHLPCSVHLQEVQILDFASHSSEVFGSFQEAKLLNKPDHMLQEDMDPIGKFYESVVSSELALVDDTFKSLPAPIIDDKVMKTVSMIIGDILHTVKPHPLSACDGIYLDWHPLFEGKCNREICSTCINSLEEVSSYTSTSELQNICGVTALNDFDLLDDYPSICKFHSEEVSADLYGAFPQASLRSVVPSANKMHNDNANKRNSKEQSLSKSLHKVSTLFESTSQSNDLNFFLNARKSNARKSSGDETMDRAGSKVRPPVVLLEEQSAPDPFPKSATKLWDIEVHQISLSDHVLGLLDHIKKSCFAILEKCTDLGNNTSFAVADNVEPFSIPQQKLLQLIIQKSVSKFTSGYIDDNVMVYISLYATKKLAYFLCCCGVYTAHLYLSNLMRSIQNLSVVLLSLEPLIAEAFMKVEKGEIESHPSLSLIERIVRSDKPEDDTKLLIVAERAFWLPVKQKLALLGCKCHEVRSGQAFTYQPDSQYNTEFTDSVLEAMLHAYCLIVSHEHLSITFPFHKFRMIIEYGGAYDTSRVSSMCPNVENLPPVHFLKVDMGNQGLFKGIFEEIDTSQHLKYATNSLSIQHILETLDFSPNEENSYTLSKSPKQLNISNDSECTLSTLHSVKSRDTRSIPSSLPDVVIIVNINSSEKKMLMSRRSSYQKILAMEKGGIQVVEREIDLPLDLIFSATVCVVWYEAANFAKNKIATEEESSIPMFMENIATNILMSLSFAFSGCIMVFEGESNSLAKIMESSDALYAAAASLDMKLQLFCSYMPESTDEIILNCIKNATRLNRGLYPAMPESETIGESFLTRFPSINPLSAHAILSSGGMLVEFLEWSHERRIQAIGKHHVPDECMSMFSALCRYGELGESKSVMTECSSVDSDISSKNLQSQTKRARFMVNTGSHDTHFSGSLCDDLRNQLNYNSTEQPKKSQQYYILDDEDILKSVQSHEFFINDEVANRKRRVRPWMTGNASRSATDDEQINNDFNDEVINHEYSVPDEQFPPFPSTINFFKKSEQIKEPSETESSLPTSRSAFATTTHRTFPTSAEINCDTDNWNPSNLANLCLPNITFGQSAAGSSKSNRPVKQRAEDLKENFSREYRSSVPGLSNRENVSPLYGRDRFTGAAQSAKERGPHLTIEFLQRVKEQSRTREQNLQCNTCKSCPGSLKNGKSYKTKSPSIIDSHRYQGGSSNHKTGRQKWKRGVNARRISSKNEEKKDSPVISPTWTPIDKRARQNLSFMRNGNAKQSKLVWRSRNSPDISCSTRKRFRDEG